MCGKACYFHFKMDQAPFLIIEDNHFHRQMMFYAGHEFTQQHGKATIAHCHNDLLAAVKRLHAICLPKLVPTAALLNEARIRCWPDCWIQLPHQSVTMPVSTTMTASLGA